MPGKLLKDLPTLGGGGLSGSEVLPISSDGTTLGKVSVLDIRTVPSNKSLFIQGTDEVYTISCGPDNILRIFNSENKGIFFDPINNFKPKYFDASRGYVIPIIKEQFFDNTNGNFYRVWENGVIEQGGRVTYTASANATPFNFLKPYTSQASYTIIASSTTYAAKWTGEANFRCICASATQFAIQDGNSQSNAAACWYAIGT